jgi:hypothetical protein
LRYFSIESDYTGRLFREGKVAISRERAAIFDRLGTNADGRRGTDCEAQPGTALRPRFSRRPATACRSSPTASAYAGWPIWGDARRDETSDWLKRDATASQASDWFAPTEPR